MFVWVQIINLTLYDYAAVSSTDPAPTHHGQRSRAGGSDCYGNAPRYAVIKERSSPRDIVVCGSGAGHVARHVFTSVSHVIDLHVLGQTSAQFLLQFHGQSPISVRRLRSRCEVIAKLYFSV